MSLGACLSLSHGGWLCKGRAAAVLELEGVLGQDVSCSAACLKLGSAWGHEADCERPCRAAGGALVELI